MDDSSGSGSFADLKLIGFVERLASAAPTPGGGAASAVTAALGASLVSMVASLSRGKPKYADYEATLERCEASGRRLAGELLRLADRDAEAFDGYSAALKMPKGTDEEQQARRRAIRAAARVAAEVPMECVRVCVEVVAEADALAGRSNVNAASDVLVAALLGQAAAHGAGENVRINLPSTGDEEYADRMLQRLDASLHDIDDAASRAREAVLSAQLREPEPAS